MTHGNAILLPCCVETPLHGGIVEYPESHAGHTHSVYLAAGWLQQLAAKRQGLAAILVSPGQTHAQAGATDSLCQVRHFLIGWGREYPEAKGSAFVTSYSIATDQGQLHVDDLTVYRDIMQAKGQRVALLMSNAPGGWIVDLAADSQRKQLRSSVMCRLPSQNDGPASASCRAP